MTIDCNIWMICLKLNWFFYYPSCNFLNLYGRYVLQYESFLNNFLVIDATDRSKIRSDQKGLFFAVSLYPFSFFANTPFKLNVLKFYFITKLLKMLTLTKYLDMNDMRCRNVLVLPLQDWILLVWQALKLKYMLALQ